MVFLRSGASEQGVLMILIIVYAFAWVFLAWSLVNMATAASNVEKQVKIAVDLRSDIERQKAEDDAMGVVWVKWGGVQASSVISQTSSDIP